jgi:predicted nucleotidyltransferase
MQDVDRHILEAIRSLPDISVLVIFGSRATGKSRDDSDLDVAVLPATGDPASRRRLLSRLATALADLSPEGRVDVVLLDEAPDLLRQRVMETGRVLLCKDQKRWRELRIRTMREFGDREAVRQLMRRAQRRRLEGGIRGGRSGRALGSLERTGRLPR